jgi:hypothetical protein
VREGLLHAGAARSVAKRTYLRAPLACRRSYLPDADVAFIDEIFKANSSLLNALLTLLNERAFDNGAGRTRVPLLCLVGASNEMPESDELDALYDRFLLRRWAGMRCAALFPSCSALTPCLPHGVRREVTQVSDDGLRTLLSAPLVAAAAPAGAVAHSTQQLFTVEALQAVRAHARASGLPSGL